MSASFRVAYLRPAKRLPSLFLIWEISSSKYTNKEVEHTLGPIRVAHGKLAKHEFTNRNLSRKISITVY